jgi:hypothetical protein
MRLVAESGLWSTGAAPQAPPLTAVLEVAGAVLSWSVDDASHEVHIAFTDPARADWLWRVVGESGHSAILEALETAALPQHMDVAAAGITAGALDKLRRLALGHWLRRWWPASRRDGIAELNSALLDAELALLTAAAEPFFADDTLDSGVAALVEPHVEALISLAAQGDPRIAEIVSACTELAEDAGVSFAASGSIAATVRREDYALAAGSGSIEGRAAAIATGVGSLNWAAVPAGIFDAAEGTVDWRIETGGAAVNAVVRTDVSGPGSPAGIAVHISAGPISGAGTLDLSGAATVPLFDENRSPATEASAWNQDWRSTSVTIGVPLRESREVRQRVRAVARTRLSTPGDDAFLAEILAAESDY